MEVVEGQVENADIFVVGQEIAGWGIVPEAHMSWKCSSVLMDIGRKWKNQGLHLGFG